MQNCPIIQKKWFISLFPPKIQIIFEAEVKIPTLDYMGEVTLFSLFRNIIGFCETDNLHQCNLTTGADPG